MSSLFLTKYQNKCHYVKKKDRMFVQVQTKKRFIYGKKNKAKSICLASVLRNIKPHLFTLFAYAIIPKWKKSI